MGLDTDESWVCQKYYPTDDYQDLMNRLDQVHAPPGGGIRLALLGDQPVGCGMFHTLSPGVVEIKRVYLSPETRGTGAGRQIMETLIADCRATGAHKVHLDTGRNLRQAINLYEKLGFKRCGPYQDIPEDARDTIVFFEMLL